MAEKKEEAAPADVEVVGEKAQVGVAKKGPPILLILIFLVNTGFNAFIAFLFFKNNQAAQKKESIEDVVEGMKKSDQEEHGEKAAHGGGHGEEKAGGHDSGGHGEEDKLADIVLLPVDTFVVNLAGEGGARYVKIDMELELNDGKVSAEIEKRKPQIRDIIITLLSSKTYDQVDSQEDKDFLREEIKNTINGFLVTGKVLKVYFSQFIIS